MPYLRARSEGSILWWNGEAWSSDSAKAVNLAPKAADTVIRVTHANNRFLDSDERMEVCQQETLP